jgi:spore coat protein U-like protein
MKPFCARTFLLLFVTICAAVTAKAAVSCSVSGSGVAFGGYESILNRDRDTSGTIFVTCSGTVGEAVNYSVSLNQGGGTLLGRTLSGGSDSLRYNLFTNVGRSQVWGNGSAGTFVVSDRYNLTASTTTRQYTVFGCIPAGQRGIAANAYADMITITLDY